VLFYAAYVSPQVVLGPVMQRFGYNCAGWSSHCVEKADWTESGRKIHSHCTGYNGFIQHPTDPSKDNEVAFPWGKHVQIAREKDCFGRPDFQLFYSLPNLCRAVDSRPLSMQVHSTNCKAIS